MTISLILLIVAIILMVLSAVGVETRIDLYKLGWACVVAAFAVGG